MAHTRASKRSRYRLGLRAHQRSDARSRRAWIQPSYERTRQRLRNGSAPRHRRRDLRRNRSGRASRLFRSGKLRVSQRLGSRRLSGIPSLARRCARAKPPGRHRPVYLHARTAHRNAPTARTRRLARSLRPAAKRCRAQSRVHRFPQDSFGMEREEGGNHISMATARTGIILKAISAFIMTALLALTLPALPARADGAASTRNIILGGALAAGTLLI